MGMYNKDIPVCSDNCYPHKRRAVNQIALASSFGIHNGSERKGNRYLLTSFLGPGLSVRDFPDTLSHIVLELCYSHAMGIIILIFYK
jgi:hypothetical protein